ncbi:hypothetical protein [Chitinophaga sp.]|uniref:hypothetical protein n=1 Tax=Chitinophaga sp. TaxID=1869181 RepID=UPI002F937D58
MSSTMISVSDLLTKYPNIEIEEGNQATALCLIDSRVHGLFACMYCILYGLFICEQENMHPVIHLGPHHLYYEEKYGENIFNYFFEQPYTTTEGIHRMKVIHPDIFITWCNISTLEKKISNLLIQKYFRLKPIYEDIIKDFVSQHYWGHRMLGVHYRGTDKATETNLVPFEEYVEKIDYLLKNRICDRIFFATDEIHLRGYIRKRYRERAVLYSLEGDYSATGTNNEKGLHYSLSTPYLHAKDAIIECYLLSNCQMLLSSAKSSMSLFSTFINPAIAHIVVEP